MQWKNHHGRWWACPPKAKVTRSNRVGCAISVQNWGTPKPAVFTLSAATSIRRSMPEKFQLASAPSHDRPRQSSGRRSAPRRSCTILRQTAIGKRRGQARAGCVRIRAALLASATETRRAGRRSSSALTQAKPGASVRRADRITAVMPTISSLRRYWSSIFVIRPSLASPVECCRARGRAKLQDGGRIERYTETPQSAWGTFYLRRRSMSWPFVPACAGRALLEETAWMTGTLECSPSFARGSQSI